MLNSIKAMLGFALVKCFVQVSYFFSFLSFFIPFFFSEETTMSSFSSPNRHRTSAFTRASYLGASKSDLERDSGFSGLIQLCCPFLKAAVIDIYGSLPTSSNKDRKQEAVVSACVKITTACSSGDVERREGIANCKTGS